VGLSIYKHSHLFKDNPNIKMISTPSMTPLTPFTSIHNKIHKIFNNPNINFFIIMNLVLLISCYTFINTSLKNSITSFISNPAIILIVLIITLFIGYYNINISILIVLLLFTILFGSSFYSSNTNINSNNNNKNNNNTKNHNMIEGFTDNTNDNEEDDEDYHEDTHETAGEKNVNKYKRKTREDNKKSREESINKFKTVLLGSFNKIKNSADNDYKQGLLENKQMMYENEKKKNNKHKNKNSSKKNSSKKQQKEDFKTINERDFDPSNEEDTNFLITKEILQDMINRIDYNFESNAYLKQYLKHRLEEIVEINKLLDDSDE